MPCMLNTALSHGPVVSISLRRSYAELCHSLSWLTCICRIPSCCDRPHRFSRWGLPMPRPLADRGRAPAIPPLPHRLRDFRGSLRRRGRLGKPGAPSAVGARGGRAAPALAHPPRPGLGGRTALDFLLRSRRAGCPGRTRVALPPGGRGPSGRRASRRGTRHPHKSLRCAPALVGMPAASRRLREPACDPRLPAGRGAINDCDARPDGRTPQSRLKGGRGSSRKEGTQWDTASRFSPTIWTSIASSYGMR